ncbi:hypothetical protein M9H77_08202 [Catharanthus roseus]|uniref:Uncharacterized protein n=1 Tax=Catharanthus roseus TaxID=4058 RepID=A0ACC0BXC0_CATRO|nr:hypothetical protein M9H77_08202 [Catharanthus roseus]
MKDLSLVVTSYQSRWTSEPNLNLFFFLVPFLDFMMRWTRSSFLFSLLRLCNFFCFFCCLFSVNSFVATISRYFWLTTSLGGADHQIRYVTVVSEPEDLDLFGVCCILPSTWLRLKPLWVLSRLTGTVEFRCFLCDELFLKSFIFHASDYSYLPLYNMSVPKLETDKFDGKFDFVMWRRKIKIVLVQNKIAPAICTPDKYPESWTGEILAENLGNAHSCLTLYLKDNVLREIAEKDNAHEI